MKSLLVSPTAETFFWLAPPLWLWLTGLENNTVLPYCRLVKTLMIRFQMVALMFPLKGDSCVLTQLSQWTQLVVFTQTVPHLPK